MEPTSTTTAVVAGIFKTYGATILGVSMGALTNRGRSFAEHSAAVLCGVTASIYLVPAIADYFAIKSEPVLNGMSCLAAVFALTLVRSISDEIPRLIAASRAKFVGGDASVENKKE